MFQHFAGYATPTPFQAAIPHRTLAHRLLGSMATLLGSLIVIKSTREGHAFFMINSTPLTV